MVGTMNGVRDFSGSRGVNGNHPDSILPDNGFAFQISPSSPTREAAASFVQKKLDELGATNRPYSLPNNGSDVLPHAVTFGSMMAGYSSVYLLPEEAVDGMGQDARLMRHDVGIMECLEIRQRLVAELDWSIEPEDSKHPGQKALAAELTKIINRIRRFTEYRRSMQEAVWVGRAGIQHRYGTVEVGGSWRRMPKPVHKDHCGWRPLNGDKIVFRYDDGREMKDGAFADQMGIRVHTGLFPKSLSEDDRKRIQPTAHGMAYFLTHEERDTILIHKHMIEDADFNDVRTAGRIHGVGVRDRIRKEWILKQETLSFMMSYLERSAGGIEIWEYPSGDTSAKNACIESAKNRSANGRNILFFPKPIGEDASAYDLKIVEPGFSGIDLINTLQDKFFGHRIKRYIIGQTLTTEADATGLGSGVADAHKDTLSQIILYDGVNHEETLTEELVRPIQLLNFPETSHWRMALKLQFESDNAKEKLEGIRTAWDMGARISEQDVLDQIGTAVPTPEDRVLMNPAFQPGAQGGAGGPGATGGLSPFGTLSGGTSVVKAGVHQAMGAEISDSADPLNPGRQNPDGDGDGWSGDGTDDEKFTGVPQKYARIKPAPGQRSIEWDEDDHPRDDIGRFAEADEATATATSTPVKSPKAETKIPDGRVKMRQAKAGGEVSEVDGKRYAGGHWMPVHGLHSGKEKPDPKPKREDIDGESPTASLNAKGKSPTARNLSPEQVEKERERRREQEDWDSIRSGPIGEIFWTGDKPGKFNFNVKKQLIPYLEQLSNDQVSAIGDWARDRYIAHEMANNRRPGLDDDEARKDIEDFFDDQAAYSGKLFVTKKLQKQLPAIHRAVEGLRSLTDLPNPIEVLTDLNEHVESVLSGESATELSGNEPDADVVDDVIDDDGKKRGPAGLTKSEAIQKAKGSGGGVLDHNAAVRATMIYLGDNSGDWKAVPVDDMVETTDEKGRQRMAPQFSFPKDYTHAETPWSGSDCCHLCATNIKNAYWIQNDDRKQVMLVGSECVRKFGEGVSGEKSAKRDMANKRRDLVGHIHEAIKSFAKKIKAEKGRNVTLQDVARSIGNEDARKRFWRVGKSLGLDPYSSQWNLKKGGVLHDDGFELHDSFGNYQKSTDAKIGNWHKSHADVARQLLTDLKRFGATVPDQYARRSDRLLSEAAAATHSAPSPSQIEAGNYAKGSFPWQGLTIKIENPKGSERHGTSTSGREWSRKMACHYGYFQRTKASDGDALDVYIGSHPDSEFVLVIKQIDQDSGKFDEFKVVVGCLNRKQAKKLYLANYPGGWKCGPSASMTVGLFKKWIAKGGPVKAASITVDC